MNRNRNGWWVIGAALGVAVATAAGAPGAGAAEKITVGTGIDPSFAHFYVAKEGGFWEKNGLDVDVKLF